MSWPFGLSSEGRANCLAHSVTAKGREEGSWRGAYSNGDLFMAVWAGGTGGAII